MKIKKILSCLLAIVMTVVLALPAMAAGDNTLTITGTEAGRTYEVYQIFTGDYDETAQNLSNVDWGEGVKDADLLAALTAITDGDLVGLFADCTDAEDVAKVLADNNTEDKITVAFADVVAKHLADTKVTETVADGATTVAFTGLADGYYFVKETTTAVNEGEALSRYMIQVLGSVSVNAKTSAPTLDKAIVEGNTTVAANNAAIGDTVSYKLTTAVPDMTGYDSYIFKVTDTFSLGLSFQNDVAITLGGVGLTKGTDYTVDVNNMTVTITFENFVQYADQTDAEIVITYSAILTQNAVIGTAGNPNTASLTYSNNPADETETGKTPDDVVVTYVTSIKLTKVNEKNEPLAGAAFVLKDAQGNASETVTSDADGLILFYGLAEGTYTLTETAAPAGYNLLKDPIILTITCEEPAGIITGEETCTWSVTGAGATVDNGIITLSVENVAGSLLPSTGGAGTVVFTIVGLVLIAVAAVILVIKRKNTDKA